MVTPTKSVDVDSLMLFLRVLLNELGSRCRISTDLDYNTVKARVKHEGLSFLTITLPGFCKDFQKSLDLGRLVPGAFQGFAQSRVGLPYLFRGFLELVFDTQSGVLLANPSVEALFAVRQLTLLFKKIEVDCSSERIASAFNEFIQCELDVRAAFTRITPDENREFRAMSAMLFGDVFNHIDSLVSRQETLPKHGPGSTAEKVLGNAKFDHCQWTKRLQDVFPWELYLASSYELAKEFVGPRLVLHEPGAELPVRVVSVPKTLKTPRIIAIEPVYMQYMQQALKEQFYAKLEEDDISSRFVGFSDQTPNQELARIGSAKGRLATLDLSEASDRVSNQHVRNMLFNYPSLARAVEATRSRKADVPGHGVIRLAKFASMGSALCFPVEAMVFTTVIFLGIQDALNTRLSRKRIKSFTGVVRVYGDDIIVPVDYVQSVIRRLETFGFKVNANKSFWTGKFRESCGRDYYDGEDITVSYCTKVFPSSRKDAVEIASLVELRNALYKRGLWQTVKHLDSVIERLIPFPAVSEESPGLGKVSFLGYETQRIHPYLHVPLVKGAVLVSHLPRNELDGYGALLKYFLKRGDEPYSKEHLMRSGRPDTVGIKIRWLPSSK